MLQRPYAPPAPDSPWQDPAAPATLQQPAERDHAQHSSRRRHHDGEYRTPRQDARTPRQDAHTPREGPREGQRNTPPENWQQQQRHVTPANLGRNHPQLHQPRAGRQAKVARSVAALADAYEEPPPPHAYDREWSRRDTRAATSRRGRGAAPPGRGRGRSGARAGGRRRESSGDEAEHGSWHGRRRREQRRSSQSPRPVAAAYFCGRRYGCGQLLLLILLAAAVSGGVFLVPVPQVVEAYRVAAAGGLDQVRGIVRGAAKLQPNGAAAPRSAAAAAAKELPVATEAAAVAPVATTAAPPPKRPAPEAKRRGGDGTPSTPRPSEPAPSPAPPEKARTPEPTESAAVTPEPTEPQDQRSRVLAELLAFYKHIGHPEKVAKAPGLVAKAEANPRALYSALLKRYPQHKERFAEARKWAESMKPAPKKTPAPTTAAPKPNWPRPSVGQVVQLAKNAREDGSLKRGEMGTIVQDAHDSQPYQVKNRAGQTFWYFESEVMPASAHDVERWRNGEALVQDREVKKPPPPPAGRGRGGSPPAGAAPPPGHSAAWDRLRRLERAAFEPGDVELREGEQVEAVHDVKVGGAVIVHSRGRGTVLGRGKEGKWRVKFVGDFGQGPGSEQPVILTVGNHDVRPLRS
eukprot:TRINITY_DN47671_c0_g1_i1.p1 TRINITY_DN47671_c0_g1~~TRINITY_DN47671_c0_g1_i1.p1  ORF type:complete len:633 (+),score=129.66 TRINITY_DN47671_c0_g1_i1:114-2012(+)